MKTQSLIRECTYSKSAVSLNHHFHDDFEILYVKSGLARIHINASQYTLSRGSTVFIGRLEEHSMDVLSEDYERYYVIPYSDRLEQMIHEPRLISIFRNHTRRFNHTLDLSKYADQLDACFEAINSEAESDPVFVNEMIASHLTQVLIYGYRENPQQFSFPDKGIYVEISTIQKYIEANYMYDIKISDIAEEHFISMNYLSKCFRTLTGCTPKQYLLDCRLAHAKSLLAHSDIPIKDIAVKCGFNDVSNFIRTFKESENITPRKYQENK